jgi:hypothetical protein
MSTGEAAQELESVRSAARWLVAAAASVLAVMLAGVQASAASKIENSSLERLVTSGLAGVVGLVAVGTVLWLAARVLVTPGWTINKIAHLELTQRESWEAHRIYSELHSRRAWLMPADDLRISVLYRSCRALLIASTEFHEFGHCTVTTSLLSTAPETVSYSAAHDGDEDRLRRRVAMVENMADQVANTANLVDVHLRYKRLVRSMPWLGSIAVLSIVAFIWATALPNGTPITNPVRMSVQFVQDSGLMTDAGLPRGCAGVTITGIALGGTFEAPVLTSIDNPWCVLRQKKIPSGVAAVIPDVPR